MRKGELRSVEERSADHEGLAITAVPRVANHRMPDGGEVDPDLMGPTCLEPAT